jgi:methylated-DNA-[protein]-cysteine S-methyltransferase
MKFYYTKTKSPFGTLTLVADEKNLTAIVWPKADPLKEPKLPAGSELIASTTHPILKRAKNQLEEYFAGKRETFDLPLKFYGTEFQKKVWKGLRTIPFGKTNSYADLAKKIGSPKACRAVGLANSKNPISIIVPCHRVIGSDGSLTGFASGLKAKSFLLNLEAKRA